VYSNKEGKRTHTRKYLGVVIKKNEMNYFVPLSSKKDSDYFVNNEGQRQIRRSVLPVIRMVSTDNVLLGSLRISDMIPVPNSELTPYNIIDETDSAYKNLVEKEYAFIRSNSHLIRSSANALYNQKTNEATLFQGKSKPKYLDSTLDFRYAEKKCLEFCEIQGLDFKKHNRDTINIEQKERRMGEHIGRSRERIRIAVNLLYTHKKTSEEVFALIPNLAQDEYYAAEGTVGRMSGNPDISSEQDEKSEAEER
jgi:protein AbiQ